MEMTVVQHTYSDVQQHLPHRSTCWRTGKAGAMQPGYSIDLYETGER